MVDKESQLSKIDKNLYCVIDRREFLRRVVRGGALVAGVLFTPALLAGCSGSQSESQGQAQSLLAPAAPTSAVLKEQEVQTAPKVVGMDPFSWAEFSTGDYLDAKGVQFGRSGDGIELKALTLWLRNKAEDWQKLHLGYSGMVYDDKGNGYKAEIYGEDLRGYMATTPLIPDIPPSAALQMVVFANIPTKRSLSQIQFTASDGNDSLLIKVTVSEPKEKLSLFSSPKEFPKTEKEYTIEYGHRDGIKLTYRILPTQDGYIQVGISGDNQTSQPIGIRDYNQGRFQLYDPEGRWSLAGDGGPELTIPAEGQAKLKTPRGITPGGWSWQLLPRPYWPEKGPIFPQLMKVDCPNAKDPQLMLFKIDK